MLETVDLGLMAGGVLTMWRRVSRMDVLDAVIELPEIVVSQYRFR